MILNVKSRLLRVGFFKLEIITDYRGPNRVLDCSWVGSGTDFRPVFKPEQFPMIERELLASY